MQSTQASPETVGSCDDDVVVFLDSLTLWFEGMSMFIAMTKGQWRDAPTSHYLTAQKFRQHTIKLKLKTKALRARISAPQPEGA
jgi:hypothetical protein